MQVIYIDSLFCLSLLTDYLLCLTVGRLCGLVLLDGKETGDLLVAVSPNAAGEGFEAIL